jgi:rhomboid protease GluP
MNQFGQSNDYPSPPPAAQPVAVNQELVTPAVGYVILAVTVVIYILQMGSQFLLGYDLPAILGMKINEYILVGQLWRLFTPMVLHGSILHIGFNMYALVIIGLPLEKRFGHVRFLLLYLSGAFAGNVFSFLLTDNPSLGASTAIFGLLGAEAVFLYRHRDLFGRQARSALINIAQIAGINLLIGLSAGIDNWGHLGGLFGGLLFTWFGGPLLKVEGLYPYFRLEDERDTGSSYLALALVLAIFGALAALKFFGLWPV